MQNRAVLRSVQEDRRITKEQDAAFFHELQRAILLALLEAGQLNEAQYRYAEDRLNAQGLAAARPSREGRGAE